MMAFPIFTTSINISTPPSSNNTAATKQEINLKTRIVISE